MPRKPDAPCSMCGKLLYPGKGSLPAGERTCRPCRAIRTQKPAPQPHACPICEALTVRRIFRSDRCASTDKNRRRAAGLTGLKARQCEVCEAAFRPSYPDQQTCTRACGVVMRRQSPRVAICRSCGTAFTHANAGMMPTRCAPCRQLVFAKQCPVCDASFEGYRARRYCTTTCLRMETRRRELATRGKTPDQIDSCRTCGMRKSRHGPNCLPCARRRLRQARSNERRRRRARKRSVISEPYTLLQVAQRDGYRCGLCRLPVDMTLRVPAHGAPTVDHVVPLADDGDDTLANVQLAHFMCNSRKSHRGMQQLALFR